MFAAVLTGKNGNAKHVVCRTQYAILIPSLPDETTSENFLLVEYSLFFKFNNAKICVKAKEGTKEKKNRISISFYLK